jgi:O-antigen/teichoic acid export membrane protein
MISNNKRIAKNTIFLYIRMLVSLFVTLYTARVVLNTLGVSDFGLYNVIGGVITLLAFITSAMAAASERFLAYDLGKRDMTNLNKTFSMTMTIYIVFFVLTLIIAETIGVWFVKYKLNIPVGREVAAFWVYQFSVFSFSVSLIRIPYNSAIIAFEKMSFYSWVSIVEVILKLVIVYILVVFSFDKLTLYSILTFLVISIVTFIYYLFIKKNFPACSYSFHWDKTMFSSMFKFAGWTMFGAFSFATMSQGVNILLNIFFNPIINAARAIAFQINSQIFSFVNNFQVAVGPQLIKYYASGDIQSMKKLYYQSSKLSYYLFYIIALPVLLEMNLLLHWWLKNVPDYTVLFARLVVIDTVIYCMAGTLIHLVQATGKNKMYEIGVGTILLLNVPISYLFLKFGYPPETTMIITIILSLVGLMYKLYCIKWYLSLSIKEYFFEVILKNLLVSIVALIAPLILYIKLEEGFFQFVIVGFVSVVFSILAIYLIGLNSDEKKVIKNFIEKKINQIAR